MLTGTLLSALCWDGVEHLEREGRAMLAATKKSTDIVTAVSFPLGGAISVLRLLLYGQYTSQVSPNVGDLGGPNMLSDSQAVASRYLPFCSRRRGRYFERLCIDYEHSGLLLDSLRECTQAVDDVAAGVKVRSVTLRSCLHWSESSLRCVPIGFFPYWTAQTKISSY